MVAVRARAGVAVGGKMERQFGEQQGLRLW